MVQFGDKHPPEDHQTFGQAIGGAIDDVIHLGFKTVGVVGRALLSPGSVLGGPRETRRRRPRPGTAAGIEHHQDINLPPPPGKVIIRCIDYSLDRVEDRLIEDLDKFLAEPRPEWASVRWINIDGLYPYVVNRLRETYNFHTLAAEDVLHLPQRPRVEPYPGHLFLISQMIEMNQGRLHCEQLSAFLFPGVVITFQETPGDPWQPIRDRIHTAGTSMRSTGADFLLYALIDALVDHIFPILEQYGDKLENMELDLLKKPTAALFNEVHVVKRELLMLRRALWPMRQMADDLRRDEHNRFTDMTRTYLRDVYEHAVQAMDILETFREVASGLTELYMSSVSVRMSEVMKFLAIFAAIFSPVTFVAGVYGMNFKVFPELEWKYGMAMFWGICAILTAGPLWYFRRRGWLGKS